MSWFRVLAVCVAAFVVLAGCDSLLYPDDGPTRYAIGDTGPAGGLIFYIDEDDEHDWRYLEAWIADETVLIDRYEDEYPWSYEYYSSIDETSTGIGTGYANTYEVLNEYPNYAAKVAAQAEHDDRDDWFLPSIDELEQMYENLHAQDPPLGNFFEGDYWSSSEVSADRAYSLMFGTGSSWPDHKTQEFRVRVARAF